MQTEQLKTSNYILEDFRFTQGKIINSATNSKSENDL